MQNITFRGIDYSKLYKDTKKITLQSIERIILKSKLPKTPKPELHSDISNKEVSYKSNIIKNHFLGNIIYNNYAVCKNY